MAQIDQASIYAHFPIGIHPPEKLVQFLEWLSESEYRSDVLLPYFHGEWLDDFWIENGSYLANHFALFIHQSDGTRVGYWFYEGCAVENAPIVILGSGSGQGEVKVIANSIEDLAARIVAGNTEMWELDELQANQEWIAQFAHWLKENWGMTPTVRESLVTHQPQQDHPDFGEWLNSWSEEQNRVQNRNPILQEIHQILRKYLPDTKEYIASITPDPAAQALMRSHVDSEGYFPWLSANFDVAIVGSAFEISQRRQHLLPESNQLEPLFRAVRIERAQQLLGRGLWFSAWVKIHPDGSTSICCQDEQPEFLNVNPLTEDYKRDLQAFPRIPEFIPPWLDQIMQRFE
jgi:hypothetical protein